jgi:hypothetical protein
MSGVLGSSRLWLGFALACACADPEPSPSSSTSADSSDGTSTGELEDTTGEPNEACANGCAIEFMCGSGWMSEAECVTWCEDNLVMARAFASVCRDAWEAVSACVGTLTCEEFASWVSPTSFPYPCSDADLRLSIDCEGQ